MNDNSKKKIKKKKGPVRFEAIIPFLIICSLIYLYFLLFFDLHIKKILEFAGTRINRAEVNIETFKTSFIRGNLLIENIEITNNKKPTNNLFSIGSIKFAFLWDALLRAKFVVNEASIENIEFDNLRNKPGKVLPPDTQKNKLAEKAKKATLEHVKQEYEGNMLADIANILGGNSSQDQIEEIKNKLISEQKIEEVQKFINEKEKEWQKRLKELPDENEIKKIEKRFKNIKLNNFKNIDEFQNSIKEISNTIKQTEDKIKLIEKTNKDFNEDQNTLKESINQIETFINKDINELQTRFKVPDIDLQNLSVNLFKKEFQPYITKFNEYMKQVEKYIPPKLKKIGKNSKENKDSNKEDNIIVPKERKKGRSYFFGNPNSYPKFWIKKILISSKFSKNNISSGNLTGQITDITSNPIIIQKPAIMLISGDFPGKEVFGLETRIIINHYQEIHQESIDVKVQSYKINNKDLVRSPEIKLSFDQAYGNISFQGKRINSSKIDMNFTNFFQKINYNITAKSNQSEKIIKEILQDIPIIKVIAKATGEWPALSWKIDSNLGNEIKKGVEKQINRKIKEAKAKAEKIINAKINKEKEKLMQDYNKLNNQLKSEINKIEQEFTKLKDKQQKTIKKIEKEGKEDTSKKIEKEGKKLLDNLKKGFNF